MLGDSLIDCSVGLASPLEKVQSQRALSERMAGFSPFLVRDLLSTGPVPALPET